MIRNVICRPEPVAVDTGPAVWVPIGAFCGSNPAIRSETPPNSSGAIAWAIERRNVRTLSARPHRPGGMMSSRAASSGGLAAEIRAVPAKQKGIAVARLDVRKPGISTSPAATLQIAGTHTRALRCPTSSAGR